MATLGSGNLAPKNWRKNYHLIFEQEIKDFVSGKTPAPDLVNWFPWQRPWLKETAENLGSVLRDLQNRYSISPTAVLYIVANERPGSPWDVLDYLIRFEAVHGTMEEAKKRERELKKRLTGPRQKREKEKDLKAIDDCLAVIDVWQGNGYGKLISALLELR